MDAQIGRLVAWLERTGLDRSTVLVLVGDHGEGLGNHGEGSHGYYIYDYAVHVPLIVVARSTGSRASASPPRSARPTSSRPSSTCRAPAGAGTQGRSLMPLMARPAGRGGRRLRRVHAPNIQFGWSPLRVLRTTRYKYIDSPRAELFDIAADPGETAKPRLRAGGRRPRDEGRARRARRENEPRGARASSGQPRQGHDGEAHGVGVCRGARRGPEGRRRRRPLADPKDKFPVFQRSPRPASWSPRTSTRKRCPCSNRRWPRSRHPAGPARALDLLHGVGAAQRGQVPAGRPSQG